MTLAEIQQRIEAIQAVMRVGDDEEAHIIEDALYQDVLRAIADGTCEGPAQAAALALTVVELDFARWYA